MIAFFRRKKFFALCLLLLLSVSSRKSYAFPFFKSEPVKSMFTFDLDFLQVGLQNRGWGFGIRYERYIAYHIAVKGGFGHSTFKIKNTDSICTTVSLHGILEYYPFSTSLNGFYFGFGSYFDYLGYGGADVPDDVKNDFVSVYNMAGLKVRACKYLIADFYGGYKYVVNEEDGEDYGDVDSYIKSGVKAGVSLKLKLK